MMGGQPCPINLLATQEIYAEGNMETIVETIPINISLNPGIVGECLRRGGFLPQRDSNLYGSF
jgi:hypothetical protein